MLADRTARRELVMVCMSHLLTEGRQSEGSSQAGGRRQAGAAVSHASCRQPRDAPLLWFGDAGGRHAVALHAALADGQSTQPAHLSGTVRARKYASCACPTTAASCWLRSRAAPSTPWTRHAALQQAASRVTMPGPQVCAAQRWCCGRRRQTTRALGQARPTWMRWRGVIPPPMSMVAAPTEPPGRGARGVLPSAYLHRLLRLPEVRLVGVEAQAVALLPLALLRVHRVLLRPLQHLHGGRTAARRAR
jgi:hypothetical protein